MHLPRLAATSALAASLVLIGVAGCSGQDDAAPDAGAPTSGSAAPAGSSETPSGEPSTEPKPSMPFDAYYSVIYSESNRNLEEEAARINLEEETIAKCMREQGFEYFPNVVTVADLEAAEAEQAAHDSKARGDGLPVDFGTVAYAEKHGYGLTDSKDEEAPPTPHPLPAKESEYMDSLTESELAAWNAALDGNPDDHTYDEDGHSTHDWTAEGCRGLGEHTVDDGKIRAWEDPTFAELLEALGTAEPSRDNDDDLAALEAEWAACMKEGGYDFVDREDALVTIVTEYDDMGRRGKKLHEKPDPKMLPAQEEYDQFFDERERPIAIADATCAESIDYDKRLHDLTVAFQQRFIDEHKKQLDALVLQYGP